MCKELTIAFTRYFKLRGTPKINKLKQELMIVINEGGSSEEILDIESQIKELVDEDDVNAFKNRKNCNILEDERPSNAFLNLEKAKKSYNDEFHQTFQKIYSKQEVEDSSEAIQEFLDSGGYTKPLE